MTLEGAGRGARAQARRSDDARRATTITKDVDALLDRYGLGGAATLSATSYNQKCHSILSELIDQYPFARDYRHARLILNRRISDVLGPHAERLKPPPPLYPVVRTHNFRTAEWMQKVREIWRWEDAFKKTLREEPGRDAYACDTLLGLFLYSAATRSAICDPAILQCLSDCVQTSPAPLSVDANEFRTELRLPVSSGTCNEIDESRGVMAVQYSLDAISLGLLIRFLKKRRKNSSYAATDNVVSLITASLNVEENASSAIVTLADFCQAALWKAENSNEGSFSSAMSEALLGRTRMLCLDQTAASVLAAKNFRPHRLSSLDLFSSSEKKRSESEKNSAIVRSVTELERLFREVLRVQGDSRKDTTQKLLNRLEPYRHEAWPPAAEILLAWLWFLLKDHSVKPSTVNRYFTAVGRLWLTVFEGLNPENLESDELATAYGDLIDLIRSDKERNYARTRLKQLHRFAKGAYGLADLTDEAFGGDGDYTLVSARIVPYSAVPAILQTICEMFASKEEGENHALMFTLAYRSGLRIGEIKKLRTMDIESSQEGWTFIRANRYANNKTSAALRKIPLRILLKSDERKIFDDFLVKRRHLDKTGSLPLFTPPGLNTPYDAEAVSRSIGDAMNAVLRSKGWKFHHLRHTAFSLLQCLIENEAGIAQETGGWTLSEARTIRETLIGNDHDRRTSYWAVALMAGHANPKTTMETYMHLMRSILGAKIARTPLDLDPEEIAGAAAISLRAARKIDTPTALIKALAKTAGKYCTPQKQLLEPIEDDSVREVVSISEKAAIDDIVTCERVLQTYQETLSIRTSAIRWRVDEATADRWLQNALSIANMKTREGAPRHISRERLNRRQTSTRNAVLLPAKPRRMKDMKEANELITTLYEAFRNSPDDVKWWASFALLNSNLSHPGVSFASPHEAKRFLQLSDTGIPRNRWVLDLTAPSGRTETAWKEAVGSSVSISTRRQPKKIRSRRPNGYARLCLLDDSFVPGPKGESEIQWQKYTAKSFRYSFHMLGILIGVNV